MLHELFWQDVFDSSAVSLAAGPALPCPEFDGIVEVLQMLPYSRHIYAFELPAGGRLDFVVCANALVAIACESFDLCEEWLETEELFEQTGKIPVQVGLRFAALHIQSATKDEYAVVVVNPTGALVEAIVEARYS